MLKEFALVLILVFVVVISTFLAVNNFTPTTQLPLSYKQVGSSNHISPTYLHVEAQLRPPRSVFFDLGANRGDSALQFSGLELHSNLGGELSEQLNTIAKRVPGPWDIIMYEAHPRFDQQLLETKSKIEAITDTETYGGPYHVTLYNTTAIGSQEGMIDFFLDVTSDVVWGSSLWKGHPDVKDGQVAIQVPIHDLAKEIMYNYRISDYVVVKMDIEGIEHDLLFNLLVRGAFPFIDELFVEFHGFAPNSAVKADCLRNNVLNIAEQYGMKLGRWSR